MPRSPGSPPIESLASPPLFTLALAAALVLVPLFAFPAQIWTDADGDGLPDSPHYIGVNPGTEVTIEIWVDSEGFNWTNYLVYLEWDAVCMSLVESKYTIRQGTNFPIDDFSHPSGIGFGGVGFRRNGTDHIGSVTFRIDKPTNCCVRPIVDIYNPYYVFSQLGEGTSYALFDEVPGTCFEPLEGREPKSWGGIKGLYR